MSVHPVPLDPKIQMRLSLIKDAPELTTLPPAQARKLFDEYSAMERTLEEPVATIENRTIDGADGPIPVRIFTPAGSGPFPIVVYYHGGGWVFGSLDSHHDFCQSLCSRAGAVVVSVDYPLAPENKFSAAPLACYAALKWAVENAAQLQGDVARLIVAGDSAGGNLAAVVALMARDTEEPRIALQLLIYPVTNYNFDTASYHEFSQGYGLSRAGMMAFWEHYLERAEDGAQPYASPLRAASLRGLPPAFIAVAHYDVLRDDGLAYAARLEQAGVNVVVSQYLSMVHGFARSAGEFEQASQLIDELAVEIKQLAVR